ncbi:hypothetical protein BKA81DRAFT_14685 [Phyllosticta paracitricarpa]|uniref:Uncharacterized protein n=1 Tax=Phyllosticta citricarpa TaxID=55181 RepID=A0ABR1L3M5_9PEZI
MGNIRARCWPRNEHAGRPVLIPGVLSPFCVVARRSNNAKSMAEMQHCRSTAKRQHVSGRRDKCSSSAANARLKRVCQSLGVAVVEGPASKRSGLLPEIRHHFVHGFFRQSTTIERAAAVLSSSTTHRARTTGWLAGWLAGWLRQGGVFSFTNPDSAFPSTHTHTHTHRTPTWPPAGRLTDRLRASQPASQPGRLECCCWRDVVLPGGGGCRPARLRTIRPSSVWLSVRPVRRPPRGDQPHG